MRKQVLAVTIGVLLVLSVFSVLQFEQIKSVQAIDSTAPTYSNIITNQTAGNYTTHFNVTIADETGLATTGGYVYGTNNTGPWVNETWVPFTTNPETVSVEKEINETLNNVICWQYWFNDTSNNNSTTGLQYSRVGLLATDGTPTNVQTAINKVMSEGYGDVIIPVGNWTWNSALSFTVSSASGFNLIGSIENETMLWETVETNITMLVVNTNTYPSRSIRLSNLWFHGHVDYHNDGDNQYGSGLNLVKLTDFRLDHCKFENFPNFAVYISANSGGTASVPNRGVIDHCAFDNPYKTEEYNDTFGSVWGYGIGMYGDGQGAVDNTTSGASNGFGNYGGHEHTIYNGLLDFGGGITYIENNNFNRCRHSIAGGMGAYYVARYNYFDNARWYGYIDMHGGGWALEAYNNTVIAGWDKNNEMWNPQAQAFELRGGSALVYNNTVVNVTDVVYLGNEAPPYISDVYIWDNTFINYTNMIANSDPANIVENVTYFLYAKPGYKAYPYPHPLVSGSTLQPAWDRINSNTTIASQPCNVSASWQNINNTQNNIFVPINTTFQYAWLESNQTGTLANGTAVAFTSNSQWMNFTITLPASGRVSWREYANNSAGQTSAFCNQFIVIEGSSVTVSITSPANTTYSVSLIPVAFTASGGTIDQKWFNCKNGTNWIYPSNLTYPNIEWMSGFINGSYTLYAFANNTLGTSSMATVMFSVQIPMEPLGETILIIVNVWWGSYW